MSEAPVTRRLVIAGRVQGVGYRAFMEDCARALGICGWVRNRRDGTVEATVQGPPQAVARLMEAARRGPPLARVDGITVEKVEGAFTDFRALPTA